MKFIDENSINRLNFKNLLSRIEILSPYGKEKLNKLSVYSAGEEDKLEKEFFQMEKIIKFIQEDKKNLMDIEGILHRLKDIKTLLKCSLEDGVLDVVDLYEIKVQTMMFEDLNKFLKEKKEIFQNYILNDLSDLLKILDPNDEKVATFHIYESYSIILKEIRKQKKEVENRLFIEKDYEKLKNFKLFSFFIYQYR